MKAFLIGAGATAACQPNVPTDTDFFNKLSNRGNFYTKLVQTLERKFSDCDEKGLAKKSLEEVIGLSQELYEAEKTVFDDTIFKAMYNLIVNPSNGTKEDELFRRRGRVDTLFTQYDSLVRHSKSDTQDFFINLNYDFMLDRAIWLSNKKKFDNGVYEIDYGFGIEDDGWKSFSTESELRMKNSMNKAVYKLHGSFNWVNSNKQIQVGTHAPPISEYDRIAIVPPTLKKFDQLKSIWGITKSRLCEADELIVIGCSISENDIELRNLLKKFIETKRNVKIVDKNKPETKKYYSSFFSGCEVSFYTKGFNLESIEFIYDNI